ncbi:MAG: hypothetical protein JST06_10865 [Bacteroidetes bacterium]|nr:hypothetical protein [Bacteroidota bacterium]MBS1630357.1 hypothetical protein [Bacteroidota bacterium]
MKSIFMAAVLSLLTTTGFAQVASTSAPKPDPSKKLMTVETSCGECNFDMDGKTCDLAVRINGKAYFVDGVSIKEYGHPHDDNGFCVAVRQAEVQGEIVNNRFKASYFKLLSPKDNQKK